MAIRPTLGRHTIPRLPSSRIALWVLTALFLAFLLLPLIIIVPISFSSARFLSFPPPGFSLQWYERFLGRPEWLASLWLSLQVATMSMIFTTVLGLLASLAMVRGQFRGKAVLYAVLLSPLIVPTIITSIALFFFFVRLQMVGSPFAMALGHTIVALPIMVIIVSATLQGFDERLEHAAISLGASPFQAFRRVTLPLIGPGVLSGGLFAFLTSFDELLIPLFLASPTAVTLPVRIWDSVFQQIEPTIAAVSTFLIAIAVVVLITSSWLQRIRS